MFLRAGESTNLQLYNQICVLRRYVNALVHVYNIQLDVLGSTSQLCLCAGYLLWGVPA